VIVGIHKIATIVLHDAFALRALSIKRASYKTVNVRLCKVSPKGGASGRELSIHDIRHQFFRSDQGLTLDSPFHPIDVRMSDEMGEFLKGSINPAIVACYEYWLSKRKLCPPDRLPGRQHLDPGEMLAFLQYALMFDVERSGVHYRFRHRLTGSHFARIFGRDVTGMYIEHTGSIESFEGVYRRLSAVVDDKQPAYGISPAPVASHDYLKYEHLTLPLATDGESVDVLFGVRCLL